MDYLQALGITQWLLRPDCANEPADLVDNPKQEIKSPEITWQSLEAALAECPVCVNANASIGEGDISANWLFVIDRPTNQAIAEGGLIGGREAQLFNAILSALSLIRETIYLSTLYKCPQTEEPGQKPTCDGLIHQQIELIQPDVMVIFGEQASQSVLRDFRSLDQLNQQTGLYGKNHIPCIVSASLGELLGAPQAKAQLWQHLRSFLLS